MAKKQDLSDIIRAIVGNPIGYKKLGPSKKYKMKKKSDDEKNRPRRRPTPMPAKPAGPRRGLIPARPAPKGPGLRVGPPKRKNPPKRKVGPRTYNKRLERLYKDVNNK